MIVDILEQKFWGKIEKHLILWIYIIQLKKLKALTV